MLLSLQLFWLLYEFVVISVGVGEPGIVNVGVPMELLPLANAVTT